MPHSERQSFYEELSIPSLAPDILAPMSSKHQFSGRDPSLEAIQARLGQ